ncbi:hypothetical protein J6590_086796 [Homalodisca vitripennis]|nr:hypothetical protein J6590_086796 [Homalodisca vitripennis]
MSKRNYSKSPVSENTLISNLVANGVDVVSNDDLSDGYLDNISSKSEEELGQESESELAETYLDDTNEDSSFESFELPSGRPTVPPRPTPTGRNPCGDNAKFKVGEKDMYAPK